VIVPGACARERHGAVPCQCFDRGAMGLSNLEGPLSLRKAESRSWPFALQRQRPPVADELGAGRCCCRQRLDAATDDQHAGSLPPSLITPRKHHSSGGPDGPAAPAVIISKFRTRTPPSGARHVVIMAAADVDWRSIQGAVVEHRVELAIEPAPLITTRFASWCVAGIGVVAGSVHDGPGAAYDQLPPLPPLRRWRPPMSICA